MGDPRSEFVEQILRSGVTLTPALAAAFAAVPREAFVPDGFQRRDGRWIRPGDPGFRDLIYRDDVLVTKVDGRTPVSSSSQPALMAAMINALDVRPGARILEIGAGTGYNAALLASLGATVTSIDVQADIADRARAALASAGIASVRVEHGDGYAGAPGHRFDRVIVTVGVAGISPRWIEQLAPGGRIVAPVDHAGTHPVLAVTASPAGPAALAGPASPAGPVALAGPVTATVVCPSGFMTATGPLAADYPGAHPPAAAAGALGRFAEFAPPRFDRPLDAFGYRTLWYAAGAWSRRATLAAVRGHEQSRLILLDRAGTGGALILPDGAVLTGGPEAAGYGAEAVAVLDRWSAAGRPPLPAWRVTLARSGDPQAPIWVPAAFELPG